MNRRSCLLLLAFMGAACADHVTDVGTELNALGKAPDTATETGPEASAQTLNAAAVDDNCPANGGSHYAGCLTDALGQAFVVNGTLYELQGPPPYGLNFRFLGGIKLSAQDLTTEGPDAAIKAYAAPDPVDGGCLPEDSEQNRVPARAAVTKLGGLQVYVDEALPSGTQLAITLRYDQLLRRHFPLANGAPCSTFEECSRYGFVARSYVGAVPTPRRDCRSKR